MRKDIHDKRQKMVLEQIKMRKDFIYNIKMGTVITVTAILCVLIIWGTIEIIAGNGKQEDAKVTTEKL